jgi:hypothetical protein
VGKPNPQNLKPFKPGQSGNPKGRPPVKPIEEIVQAFLAERISPKNGGEAKERLMAMLEAQWIKAIKTGDTRAADYLTKYGFGLPKQKLEHSGNINTVVVDRTDADL